MYCKDTTALVEYLSTKRGFKKEIDILKKVGIDQGGDFHQICLRRRE